MIKRLRELKEERRRKRRAARFHGSEAFWEAHYSTGGTSGSGSYGRLALFKAEVINEFIERNAIGSVIEFGCGDGNQLSLGKYPAYIGLDVSRTVLKRTSQRYRNDCTKSFFLYDCNAFVDNAGVFTADLALSLDVVYHLVEDEIFEKYMRDLFAASKRFVIVYSANKEGVPDNHLRLRRFTDWVERFATDWRLSQTIPNRYPYDPDSPDETSISEFYIFGRSSGQIAG